MLAKNKGPLPSDLISTKKAAQLAKISISGLHRWIFKGRVRGWKRGDRWFVSRAEVEGQFRQYYVPLTGVPGDGGSTASADAEAGA